MMTANAYARDFLPSNHMIFAIPKGRPMSHPTGRFARPALLISHVFLVSCAAWWAFVLYQPGDTFATSPSYRLFPAIMSESDWTTCFAAAAALGILGIFWSRARVVSTVALAVIHGVSAGLFANAGPGYNTGMGIYTLIALLAVAILIVEKIAQMRAL
jgi:hypothetical protein